MTHKIRREKSIYLSSSGKILAKRIPRSASKFAPVTYPVPKIIWLTGVWDGISIGNFCLKKLESLRNSQKQKKAQTEPEMIGFHVHVVNQ
jgi:hypothetical protein